MVQRVAEAIGCIGSVKCAGLPGQRESPCEDCIIVAQAAIAAMREPTEAMVLSAYGIADAVIRPQDGELERAYTAMIDEALK